MNIRIVLERRGSFRLVKVLYKSDNLNSVPGTHVKAGCDEMGSSGRKMDPGANSTMAKITGETLLSRVSCKAGRKADL